MLTFLAAISGRTLLAEVVSAIAVTAATTATTVIIQKLLDNSGMAEGR